MKPFKNVWDDILAALESNDHVVRTLVQGKKNIVNSITEDGLLVTTKSAPQFVSKDWIQDAWNALNGKKSLTAEDIPGHGRHRSSFIMALLSLLSYIDVSKDPIATLSLKDHGISYNNKTWIFQGNPKKFNIEGYISKNKYIWWSVRQKHYEKEIRVGDEVFLWRAEAGRQVSGGIIARGTVIGLPILRTDEESKEYWYSNDWSVPGIRVPIELHEVKVTSGFIPRNELVTHDALKNLLILRMATQTNYKLEDLHAREIRSLWGVPDIQYQIDEEEANLFPEGKRVFRQHRVIERNPYLIKAAKEYHKKRMNGELKCMVCDFSFAEKYGAIGEDFIEGHHTKPISEIEGEYNATVEDIALVCSNCHRMLHRKRPWLSMSDLKNLICRKEV